MSSGSAKRRETRHEEDGEGRPPPRGRRGGVVRGRRWRSPPRPPPTRRRTRSPRSTTCRSSCFSLIRAIGIILLGFGIVQVGISLKGHDPSQRANGFLTLAGGLVITFAREILNIITG